jgi:hypothetical protein
VSTVVPDVSYKTNENVAVVNLLRVYFFRRVVVNKYELYVEVVASTKLVRVMVFKLVEATHTVDEERPVVIHEASLLTTIAPETVMTNLSVVNISSWITIPNWNVVGNANQNKKLLHPFRSYKLDTIMSPLVLDLVHWRYNVLVNESMVL